MGRRFESCRAHHNLKIRDLDAASSSLPLSTSINSPIRDKPKMLILQYRPHLYDPKKGTFAKLCGAQSTAAVLVPAAAKTCEDSCSATGINTWKTSGSNCVPLPASKRRIASTCGSPWR